MNDADYENMPAFSCGVKALDDFFHFDVGRMNMGIGEPPDLPKWAVAGVFLF